MALPMRVRRTIKLQHEHQQTIEIMMMIKEMLEKMMLSAGWCLPGCKGTNALCVE